jgi:hypothetical protein
MLQSVWIDGLARFRELRHQTWSFQIRTSLICKITTEVVILQANVPVGSSRFKYEMLILPNDHDQPDQ